MHIGIDVHEILVSRGGISRYIYNLVENLVSFDRKNDYFLFSHSRTTHYWRIKRDNVREVILRLPHRSIWLKNFWAQALFPVGLKLKKIDIIHSPSFFLPRFLPCKSVVTIHDLAFEVYPEFCGKSRRESTPLKVRSAAKRADRIIVPSQNTKRDIVRLYGVPEEKIEVILYGKDDRYHKIDDSYLLSKVKKKYHILGKFILYVGAIEPRKNLVRLLEAFSILKKKKMKHTLIMAGQKLWGSQEIVNAVDKLKLKRKVIFTDYVSSEELPLLYNAADLFVFPSLYEGFGLPPLEAMACGTPVITSNVSSLPEVVGEAAVMVDPYDVPALAEAMERLLTDERLRKRCIERGLERTRICSWEKTARKTLAIYEQVHKAR